MKTIRISTLLAAALALGACHAHHRQPANAKPATEVSSEDAENEKGARQMETDIEAGARQNVSGTDSGDITTVIDNDKSYTPPTDAGAEPDNAIASTTPAAEASEDSATLATAADKAGAEAKSVADDAAKTVTDAGASIDGNASAPEAKKPGTAAPAPASGPASPTAVAVEVETIDRHAQQITFRLRDDDEEIRLQAGRELKVDFSELQALTGLKPDAAIAKMHEGQDLELDVNGAGATARVTKVKLP